ncbi:MAG: radical SAM protein [Oscillospiraceae bacterium]|nr:radical SAM protein [Oscillospiraceae bacterium]
MPALSMLIKPVSSLCNINCKYCFYHTTKDHGIMDISTLETIVRKAFDTGRDNVTFAFQGGEPTLAGIDFYRRLIELCYSRNAGYTIQTNGINIDEEWAEFFQENNFLVGLSLDGTKDLHDKNRCGTFNKVVKAASILKKHDVQFNILTVVNNDTARNIAKIYRFYKNQNWKYLQFIPCLGSDELLTPQNYLYFLKTLFDLWYNDDVSIRYFDNLLNIFAGRNPESCGMTGMCGIQFVIESDGSVYPCDFYVLDEYKIGNINEHSFKEIFESETAQTFIKQSCIHSPKCKSCKWYIICRGGCRRYTQDGEYKYCGAMYEFLNYAGERFIKLL